MIIRRNRTRLPFLLAATLIGLATTIQHAVWPSKLLPIMFGGVVGKATVFNVNKELGIEKKLLDAGGDPMLIEGDILVHAMPRSYLEAGKNGFLQVKASLRGTIGWTPWHREFDKETGKYVIPFQIDHRINDKIRKFIAQSHAIYTREANIRFRAKAANDQYWLLYDQSAGCSSFVGMLEYFRYYGQPLSLVNNSCEWLGAAIHELGHFFGMPHEQDRQGFEPFVNKVGRPGSADMSGYLGNTYDLLSVMCTSEEAYKKNWSGLGGKHYLSSCDWNVLAIAYPGPIPPTPCSVVDFVVDLFEPNEHCILHRGIEACTKHCTMFDIADWFSADLCKNTNDKELPQVANEWMILNCAD